MVPHEERNRYHFRSPEAESPVFPFPGRQFRPIFSRQFFVAEKVIHFPPPPLSVVYSFPVRTAELTHDDMCGKHVYLCVYVAHFIPL